MKVALVHDYIKEYGGAERVLEAIHEIYPQAPVFTTVYLPEFLGPHRARFADWEIKTSFLQWVPFKAKLISVFRIIAPFIFRGFDFSKYDVVIVSATGAYAPNNIHCHPERSEGSLDSSVGSQNDILKKPIHVCYCHTPPRYLYGYPTAREWKKNVFIRILGEVANHFLRLVDFKSAQNVDFFIANSKNVAQRIKKFYRRDSVVIYPPIEARGPHSIENFVPPSAKDSYFLTGGRLARPKRIDLVVTACTKLKLPLKVFGKQFAGYGDELKTMAGPTVEFLGEVTDKEKWELMKNARAFIFPAEEEDFGITPVEAMAVGTPVIALRSGGVVESVVEGKTGLFFDKPTCDSLVNILKQFEKVKFNHAAIIKHAQKFSKERFKKKIETLVDKVAA